MQCRKVRSQLKYSSSLHPLSLWCCFPFYNVPTRKIEVFWYQLVPNPRQGLYSQSCIQLASSTLHEHLLIVWLAAKRMSNIQVNGSTASGLVAAVAIYHPFERDLAVLQFCFWLEVAKKCLPSKWTSDLRSMGSISNFQAEHAIGQYPV